MAQVVFLESNLTGSGYDAIAWAHHAGHRVVLLSRDPQLYGRAGHAVLDMRTVDEVVRCGTNDAGAVVAAASALHEPVDAVVSVGEWHAIQAADVARCLGLPGTSPSGVRAARDKATTLRLCADAGVAVPVHTVVDRADDMHDAWLGGRCVVKPLDDAGSNGVRLCDSAAAAAQHARRLLRDPRNERDQPRRAAVLVEEYVDGPEFSAEVLIRDREPSVVALTAKCLGPLPHFVETGHVVPAPVRPVSETS